MEEPVQHVQVAPTLVDVPKDLQEGTARKVSKPKIHLRINPTQKGKPN